METQKYVVYQEGSFWYIRNKNSGTIIQIPFVVAAHLNECAENAVKAVFNMALENGNA